MQTYTKLGNHLLGYMKQLYNKADEFNTSARSSAIQKNLNVCGAFSMLRASCCLQKYKCGRQWAAKGSKTLSKGLVIYSSSKMPLFFCPLWALSFRGTWAMQFLLILMICTYSMLGKNIVKYFSTTKKKNNCLLPTVTSSYYRRSFKLLFESHLRSPKIV